MRLKGIVHVLIFNDLGTVYESTQENLIPDASWVGILGQDAVAGYFNRRISISTSIATPVATNDQVTNVIGTCATLNPTVFIENVDPPFGSIFGQIQPVGVSRIFSTVALTALPAGNAQSIPTTQAFALLLLAIPCTQGINDFVNITYSIQFIDDVGSGFANNTLNRYDLGRALMGLGLYRIGALGAFASSPPLPGTLSDVPAPIVTIAPPYNTQGANAVNFKWNYRVLMDRNTGNGIIFNAIAQGFSNDNVRAYAMTRYPYDLSPIQTGFKQGSGANVPFFDNANIANSQGTAVLNGSTWSGGYPQIYRFLFTASGAVGVATYRFSTAKHLGFINNTFQCRDVNSPYRTPNIRFTPVLHGWRGEDFDVHRLDNTRIAQYDINGVSTVDTMSGAFRNYDAASVPPLPATNIRQIAVDTTNLLIYVACRETGLWTIDTVANTVTNNVVTQCYGVDVGRLNVAVAIFNGSIRRSSNWAVSLPFAYAPITADWTRVRFLKADPQNAADQIAIVADSGTGAMQVVWHQFSTNISTAGPLAGLPNVDGGIVTYPASLDVSDINSIWAIFRMATNENNLPLTRLTFGSALFGVTANAFALRISPAPSYLPVVTNQFFSKVSFYQDGAFARNALAFGSTVLDYPDFPLDGNGRAVFTSFAIHMDSGIILCTNFMRQIFSQNALFWTDYGWDGAAWIAGNVNSKTTHLSADVLINGLTIAFVNGASPPQFVATEKQVQSVCAGILKDSATTLEFRTAWYSKPMNNETIAPTPITASLALPSGVNPTFRRLDTDSFQGHRFFIDGTPASLVRLDGTAPLPMEVSIQASGSATIAFNVADVGKTLTGNYLWIEV